MKYQLLLTLVLMMILTYGNAQQTGDSTDRARLDSVRLIDSMARIQAEKDSLLRIAQVEIRRAEDSIRKVLVAKRKAILASTQDLLRSHPALAFDKAPLQQTIHRRKRESDDGMFYFITALVLYLALMRIIFYKYISTMFTLFFRATLRQQQLREQLLQAPLPALLMNIFFVVSVATYLTLVAGHAGVVVTGQFWSDLLYAIVLIAGIYLVKYIFLNIVGWIFGMSALADTYIFIVFLINKMMGIFLLPFIALLAFPTEGLAPQVLMISYILIGGLLFYRFMISYRPVRSEIKLSRIHFFFYLCAFEIAPLLLIYKVLLEYADRSQ